MSSLKVYEVNYDGRVRRGVCTSTKKRALELLGVTAYTFNLYGMVRDWIVDADDPLRLSPDTPMEAHMNRRNEKPWYPLGTFRDFSIYEGECKRNGLAAQHFEEWVAGRASAA
ncbi:MULTISPECIES: hypothetical protein [Burkholderia]|uniref:hypothetical protein n=1 Tax=Burkholderia TaxID=32008 RepID=UPI0012F4DF26|nr:MULTISPECIES: hypothetical protein [Burkholderia]UEC05449.1 hypothetical protein LK462_35165 [Burkholderia vietnamiensis]